MAGLHNAHLVLDGGGRKGAHTPRVVYELLRQGVAPRVVACTSAGIISGVALVAAQHEAGEHTARIPDLFHRNARSIWNSFTVPDVSLPEINQAFAAACWQVTDRASTTIRQFWQPFGKMFVEPHLMAPLVRGCLPQIDAALRSPHSSRLLSNRVHLSTGIEEIIDSKTSWTTLEDLLDTANLPYALPARGGRIDGAFSGYNGPLHKLPDDGLPCVRVRLPKPKFADHYAQLFAAHQALYECALRAEAMPDYKPRDPDAYLEIKFDEDPSQPDALPTRAYLEDADRKAKEKVDAVIESGALDKLLKRPKEKAAIPLELAA